MSTKTTRYEECRGDIAKDLLIRLLRLRVKPAMTTLLLLLYCSFIFCHVLRVICFNRIFALKPILLQ